MTAVLAWHDGFLCVAETTVRWGEPYEDTLYWPIVRTPHARWSEDLGKPLLRETNTIYSLKIGGFWKRFELLNGGQTTALKVESFPIPRPKGLRKTTEVRWHHGTWQKYTRTGGWTHA